MLALQRMLSFWLCKDYLSAALFSVKLPSFHPEKCEDFVLMMHFTLQLYDILLPDYRKVIQFCASAPETFSANQVIHHKNFYYVS